MISLSDSLQTAASLLGLGAVVVPVPGAADPQTVPDVPLAVRGRLSSPDEAEADDPFFLAVAAALREAGYLDS